MVEMFVSHPLVKPETIEEREYQRRIVESALKKNTLVVLPTGVGKTVVAALVIAERLRNHPGTRALFLAPTRPLASQHAEFFRKCLKLSVSLVTGTVKKPERKRLYGSDVVVATPQTVENDLKSGDLDLRDFSLLIVDEAHRSVGNYAYTFVAREFVNGSGNPLILGLTASPGSDEEKIREICSNLFIRSVELRTEEDEDLKPYVKRIEIEVRKVELKGSLAEARELLREALRDRLGSLGSYGPKPKTKREVLALQKRFSAQVKTNPSLFRALSLTAEVLKIWHALELLETQSSSAAVKYLGKLGTRASDRAVLSDERISRAIVLMTGEEHPKLEELVKIVKEEMGKRIIVFSHFRDNIQKIREVLEEVCNPAVLVGQAGEDGLTQREQVETVKRFEEGVYDCLITSPVGEEGLHISSADVGIFYDSVPSEIRTIQRRGRVGRVKIGKVIFLVTKNTRDEVYFYVARRKERKMKEILKEMKPKERSLQEFL